MKKPTTVARSTIATIKTALDRAAQLGVSHIVVASTSGRTALALGRLVEARRALGVRSPSSTVCVTHHAGFRAPGRSELSEEAENRLAKLGIPVLRTTHLFAGIDRAVRMKFGGLYPAEVVASTYRTFGEGTKVGVEIACMALDAGLVPHGRDVVAIAGTGSGADTALVVRPAHSRQFFDTRVREVVTKPRDR